MLFQKPHQHRVCVGKIVVLLAYLVCPFGTVEEVIACGSAWKRDPGIGVIGVEKGPLIPVV
jgi:hypothetical protein